MADSENLTEARRRLALWEGIRNERGRVSRDAQKLHQQAIRSYETWVAVVKSLEAEQIREGKA